MPDGKTIVHISHEAAARMGGIGQVLQSLITCKTYLNSVKRSIIIGPWFNRTADSEETLGVEGRDDHGDQEWVPFHVDRPFVPVVSWQAGISYPPAGSNSTPIHATKHKLIAPT